MDTDELGNCKYIDTCVTECGTERSALLILFGPSLEYTDATTDMKKIDNWEEEFFSY